MSRMELLGPIIKQAREEKGWTQQELAERLEISVEDVEKHEKGESDLDTLTVAKYIFLLNISPDVTIYEDDVEEALLLDKALRARGVPSELHVYPSGGHGQSLADRTVFAPGEDWRASAPCAVWVDRCTAWLHRNFGDYAVAPHPDEMEKRGKKKRPL